MKKFIGRTCLTILIILIITLFMAYMDSLTTGYSFGKNLIDYFINQNYIDGTPTLGYTSMGLICSIIINILIEITKIDFNKKR